jgi:hypothetical protein
MGSSSDIKEEDKKLKERIEKETQPEIERLTQEMASKKENEEKLQKINKELQQQIEKLKKNKIDLSPEYIQELMEENYKMKDEIYSLKNDLELAKAINLKYKNYCMNLFSELEKLKLICGQYQLMLLSQNQKPLNKFFNNNMMDSWRNQIIDIINNNSFINSMNNNNCNNNFNYKVNNNTNMNSKNINKNCNYLNNNQDRVSTIIFSFENKVKYPIVIFPKSRLMEVYYLASIQINNRDYSDIYKLKFLYNGVDITSQFLNNDEVSCLNLSFPSPIIEVIRQENVLNKHC